MLVADDFQQQLIQTYSITRDHAVFTD